MRIVFYYLILVLKGYNSLFFKGKKITAFFKTLNKCFKDYKIKDNIKKKKRAIKYFIK
jgi:hypothetical protein